MHMSTNLSLLTPPFAHGLYRSEKVMGEEEAFDQETQGLRFEMSRAVDHDGSRDTKPRRSVEEGVDCSLSCKSGCYKEPATPAMVISDH